MLGRFLEVSVQAADVQASVEFYESLGFVQATVGDALTHPYAVVTDGRLYIGLHDWQLPSPILTWVLPDVRKHGTSSHRSASSSPWRDSMTSH
jgi:hypothetical protein